VLLEIRWHGRAGQGVKTAAYLLAEAAMDTGKYIQAFPEYGAERSGAPLLRLPESVMNQSEYIMVFALLMW